MLPTEITSSHTRWANEEHGRLTCNFELHVLTCRNLSKRGKFQNTSFSDADTSCPPVRLTGPVGRLQDGKPAHTMEAKIGDRHITIRMPSQAKFMAELFCRAKNAEWHGANSKIEQGGLLLSADAVDVILWLPSRQGARTRGRALCDYAARSCSDQYHLERRRCLLLIVAICSAPSRSQLRAPHHRSPQLDTGRRELHHIYELG